MGENGVSHLEMMILEFIDENHSVEYSYRKVINSSPEFSMVLNRNSGIARKLLHGYRTKTLDEDVIISALSGLVHSTGTVREGLENEQAYMENGLKSMEKGKKGNRTYNFFRLVFKLFKWIAEALSRL